METFSRWAPKLSSSGINWVHDNIFFSELCTGIIQWFHDNIFFSKAAPFISGLVFSHSLVEHAVVSILISYLTDNWKKHDLSKAAAIVNAQEGVSAIMVIVVAHISDAYIGRFKTILYTNASYIIGLVLLASNTPGWMFYVAVVLVALGQAGKEPPLKSFLADQLREKKQNLDIDEERAAARARTGARTNVWWRFARFLGAAAAISLTNASWEVTFRISAMVMGVAYLLFCSSTVFYYCKKPGIDFYHCEKPTGSPLGSVFRVFKVAMSKRHIDYAQTAPHQFFMNDNNKLPLEPDIPFFRCLDKSAIVESRNPSPEEQVDKGKLCTARQVKEVKRLLEMIPMWTTFLVYSLVEATGSTFFLEQRNNLNSPIGNGNIILIGFIVLQSFSSFIMSSLIPKWWNEAKQRHATLVRIGAGMACSILCCIAAWLVEVRRLNLVDDLDDPGETIAMSIFWLVPQFILLGLMEGLAQEGLYDFFYDQVGESMASYGPPFSDCVLGIGKFLTILCVFVFKSWFGKTINTSHLDRYYRMLALLSLGNLCFYWFVSTFYSHKEAQGSEEEPDTNLEDGIITDSVANSSLVRQSLSSRSMSISRSSSREGMCHGLLEYDPSTVQAPLRSRGWSLYTLYRKFGRKWYKNRAQMA